MSLYHPEVYSPAEDTHLLLEAARRALRPGDQVLEIGTGSGEISYGLLPIAERVVATDINPHAAGMAYSRGVPVIRTDLFFGIRGRFDLIIFNPPYLPTTAEERMDDWLEYALDGGEDGRKTIRRFLASAPDHLTIQGRILLLISSLTGIAEVTTLFTEAGMIAFTVAEEVCEGEKLIVLLGMRDLCRV